MASGDHLQDDIWRGRGADPSSIVLHGSAVAKNGRALIFGGPSGIGKTSLALTLMAYGARFVADDLVRVSLSNTGLEAGPTTGQPPGVELRHIGPCAAPAPVTAHLLALVDLRPRDVPRLPEPQTVCLLGQDVPVLHTCKSGPFAPALWHYLCFHDAAPANYSEP